MKKAFWLFLLLWVGIVLAASGSVSAGVEYQSKLEQGLTRGFKNIVGAPLEIPVTIAHYNAGPGRPVIRHVGGFFDGFFRMVEREVNGLFDTVLVFLPGEQDGHPMTPETLF